MEKQSLASLHFSLLAACSYLLDRQREANASSFKSAIIYPEKTSRGGFYSYCCVKRETKTVKAVLLFMCFV